MVEPYRVRLTLPALADLDEIGDYRAQMRGLKDAEALVEQLREHASGLDRFALRGPVPKELEHTGRTDIRQTMLGRYRIFYLVSEGEVAVFMFVDGRRDMDALLASRLLAPDPPA